MDIIKKILSLIFFIMICFIIIKELYDLTIFAFNYHSIYNVAKINKMPCGNLHTEFETPRFQISKNLYSLHMDNDIYNSKSYIIIIFVFSIIFFLYSLVVLYDYNDILKINNNNNNNNSFLDNILPSFVIQNFKKIFIGCLIISFIVYYSIALEKRFGKGGIEGYYGESNDRYGFDVSLYVIIAIILTFNIIINLIYSNIEIYYNAPITVLSSLLVVFAFFFMNNLFNIVMSFQDNQDVDDKYNGGNYPYDISYGNENLFYKRYLNSKNFNRVYDIYHDIFNIDNDSKSNKEIWGYDNTAYNISKGGDGDNLPMYTGKIRNFLLIIFIFIIIVLFVIIVLLIYKFLNNDNYIDIYISFFSSNIIVPLFLIFAVIFVIIATMQYNTFINKDLLLNLNGFYKYDLNKLNNSVVPALYIADKTKISDNDKTGRYIVYNVMISYFINSINILDNSIYTDNNNLFIQDKYNDNNTLNTFYENNDNDINDEYKFKIYTDLIKANIDNYWKYENIDSIINNSKLFNTEQTHKLNNTYFDIDGNDISYKKEDTKDTKDTKKDINKNIKQSILYSLYYLNSDNFDSKYTEINKGIEENVNKKNSAIKEELHNKFLFINNKEDTVTTKSKAEYDNDNNKAIYSYKFILKGPLNGSDDMVSIKTKTTTDSLKDKYKYYMNDIDNLIDNFLKNMEILYKHLYLFKIAKDDDKQVKNKLAGIIINFKDIIHQNLISDIEVLNNKIKEAGDINENSLFKKIKSMYNQFNGEKLDNISLYEKNEINIVENSKDRYGNTTDTINNTFNTDVPDSIIVDSSISNKNAYDNANFVIKERLVVLFSTYCITLFISYKLLNNF